LKVEVKTQIFIFGDCKLKPAGFSTNLECWANQVNNKVLILLDL
jgi:hypothetical protein